MEKNAREQKFSPKDEYHIHLKLYEPLNNPLLIQYLDAFWQIYQQVEKGLPPPILSPEKLAMQHRELIDAVEAHDLVRMQRAILQYFQSIRQHFFYTKKGLATVLVCEFLCKRRIDIGHCN